MADEQAIASMIGRVLSTLDGVTFHRRHDACEGVDVFRVEAKRPWDTRGIMLNFVTRGGENCSEAQWAELYDKLADDVEAAFVLMDK